MEILPVSIYIPNPLTTGTAGPFFDEDFLVFHLVKTIKFIQITMQKNTRRPVAGWSKIVFYDKHKLQMPFVINQTCLFAPQVLKKMCSANYEFKSLLILETKVTKAIALIGFYSVPTNPHINNITRGVPRI